MGKYKTDLERLEKVKEYKLSGKTITEFAKEKNIPRATLRDWVNAYDNIDGSFVRLEKEINKPNVVLANDECKVKMLSTDEIYKKSSHFSRFDHSIVVIEFDKLKITTSLDQALKIMEQYYDRYK